MSITETVCTSTGHRPSSTWSNPRQPLCYIAAEDRLPIRPGEAETDALVHAEEDILSPPCFNWKTLENFLGSASMGDLTDYKPSPQLTKLCLLDDRCSSSCQTERLANPQFQQQPHSNDGDSTFRANLNEQELYLRLLEKVSASCYPSNLVTNRASTRHRKFTPTDEYCMYSR